MPDDLEELTGDMRRMWSTASLTSKLGAKEWLFLNRLQWGLNAVLAQLHATGPWRDEIEEILAMPIEAA